MTTWYSSDFHIGHKLVAGLRGFDDTPLGTDEHDAWVEHQWRCQVQPNDHVWLLGDLSLNMAKGLAWLAPLPGTKHLVTGNHDVCHPAKRDSYKFQRRYMEVFTSVQAFARHKFDGTSVLLSHYPYSVDHTAEARDTQYRLRDEGLVLLHGHTHSTEVFTGPREIHVGLDAHKQLLSRDDVACLVATAVGKVLSA